MSKNDLGLEAYEELEANVNLLSLASLRLAPPDHSIKPRFLRHQVLSRAPTESPSSVGACVCLSRHNHWAVNSATSYPESPQPLQVRCPCGRPMSPNFLAAINCIQKTLSKSERSLVYICVFSFAMHSAPLMKTIQPPYLKQSCIWPHTRTAMFFFL